MKFIFDFDDVLFNTKKFKEKIYLSVEKVGISRDVEETYYKEFRKYAFSLKIFLTNLFAREKKRSVSVDAIYEEIMSDCERLLNKDLLEIVQKLSASDCFILTSGDEEFQKDKIRRSGIEKLFSEITVVPDSKREAMNKICAQYKDEKVIFIDDKQKFLDDLDLAKCPNLKTILCDEQGLEKLKAEIIK